MIDSDIPFDNSLLLQRQAESVAQRLLFACEVTTGPLVVFLRRGCCCELQNWKLK
jgi:hypothetical protein